MTPAHWVVLREAVDRWTTLCAVVGETWEEAEEASS
jgi:hypothetical protein